MKAFAIAAIAALAAAAPAAAQAPVPLPAFDSVELRGGGSVTLRYGPAQRVTLLRGDTATSRFSVDGEGRLRIDACMRSCRDYRLEVEIVTPDIEGVAVQGGGAVRAEGAFPARGMLAVAVTGGGAVDVTAVESDSVAAAVRGGGAIRTLARVSLIASVTGGGSILYAGDPAVTSAVNGGGSILPAGR